MTTEHLKSDDGKWELKAETVSGHDLWWVNGFGLTARHYADVKSAVGDRLAPVPPPDPDREEVARMVKVGIAGSDRTVRFCFPDYDVTLLSPSPFADDRVTSLFDGLVAAHKAARAEGHAAGVAEFREKAVALLDTESKESVSSDRSVYTAAAMIVRDIK